MAISREDRQFLLLCEEVRQDSHDPDRKVGAIIINADGQQVGRGTNAPPSALNLTIGDSQAAIRQDQRWKYFVLEHAERNAIFDALLRGKSLKGTTMYSTLFPCADCARAIVASGVSRLVVLGTELDLDRDQKWFDHYRHAEHIFELARVVVETINPDELTESDRP